MDNKLEHSQSAVFCEMWAKVPSEQSKGLSQTGKRPRFEALHLRRSGRDADLVFLDLAAELAEAVAAGVGFLG